MGKLTRYIRRFSLEEELNLKDFKNHSGASDFTKDWIEIRRKMRGAGNKSAKIKGIRVNKKKGFITFVFNSVPTYTAKAKAVTQSGGREIKKNVSNYTQEVRIVDFFKWAETKPGYDKKKMTRDEVKEVLNVSTIQVDCNCPAFTWQGLSYYLTQLDGSIIPNNIEPKRWDKYHDQGNDIGLVCKHLSAIFQQIEFWLPVMTGMVNKYLKNN